MLLEFRNSAWRYKRKKCALGVGYRRGHHGIVRGSGGYIILAGAHRSSKDSTPHVKPCARRVMSTINCRRCATITKVKVSIGQNMRQNIKPRKKTYESDMHPCANIARVSRRDNPRLHARTYYSQNLKRTCRQGDLQAASQWHATMRRSQPPCRLHRWP